MGLAFRKVPCLQIPLRSKINFSGEHSPDPQGRFHHWEVSSIPKMQESVPISSQWSNNFTRLKLLFDFSHLHSLSNSQSCNVDRYRFSEQLLLILIQASPSICNANSCLGQTILLLSSLTCLIFHSVLEKKSVHLRENKGPGRQNMEKSLNPRYLKLYFIFQSYSH